MAETEVKGGAAATGGKPAAGRKDAKPLPEQEILASLLEEMKSFARQVPVAHYVRGADGRGMCFDYDKDGEGREAFFREDYSALLHEDHRTGQELLRLIKQYDAAASRAWNFKLWKLFVRKRPQEYSDDYCDFIDSSSSKVVEGMAKSMWVLLTTGGFTGRAPYEVLHPYLSARLRKGRSDEMSFFVPQDEKSQHFFQSLRIFRNKSSHVDAVVDSAEDRREGVALRLFAPPPSASDEAKQRYYLDLHLRMVLYVLILFSRYYKELTAFLQERAGKPAGMGGEAEPDRWDSESKRHISKAYIGRVHDRARASLRQLFAGVGLSGHQSLPAILPDLDLQHSGTKTLRRGGDGAAMLANDLSHRLKLVAGQPGSGKTVMLLRMLIHDQPRLTPFYLSLDRERIASPGAFLHRLEAMVLGDDLLTMHPALRDKVVERLHSQLAEGSVVFFIDSFDAAPECRGSLFKFISKYPSCQYIVASQSDALNDEQKQAFSDKGFVTYRTMPLSEGAARKAARILSQALKGQDHSDTLMQKIALATQGSEMGRLPLTFMQLAYIFETTKQRNVHRFNRSQLNWEFANSIRRNALLEAGEKQALLEQLGLKTFSQRLDDAVALCRQVYALFAEGAPEEEWSARIMQHPLVASKGLTQREDLQQFFELLQLIDRKEPALRREAAIVRTLATVAMLSSGVKHEDGAMQFSLSGKGRLAMGEEGMMPMPLSLLRRLADAVSLLPDHAPAEADRHAGSPDSAPVWYRLQPHYIVRHYLDNLFTIYQQAGLTPAMHHAQVSSLFTATARMGHDSLTARLFEPFWMRIWLMSEEDTLPGTTMRGYALDYERNRFLQALIKHTANHDTMVFMLLQQKRWIDGWRMEGTARLWWRCFHDAVLLRMNDEQRERLFRQLTSQPPNVAGLGYYTNFIIASMDSLSLADCYDVGAERTLDDELLRLLMDREDHPAALKVLALAVLQMTRIDPMSIKRNGIVDHLIRYGAPTMPEVSDTFWKVIMSIPYESDIHSSVVDILDKIPLEDIRRDVARSNYEAHIYDFQQKILEEEHRMASQWLTFESSYRRQEMFRKVSKEQYKREHIQYTFYSQPSDITFEVATECIDEMPEGKFCRLKDAGGRAVDRWFYVEDVVVLKKERPIDYIAELTLNLPTGAPRQNQGSFSFAILPDEPQVKYIHLFQKRGSNQVVVRIEDQEWAAKLLDGSRARLLKDNPQVEWGTYRAELMGIDVRELSDNMRIIRMQSVASNSGREKVSVPIPDIPHQGTMSFYNPLENRKYTEALNLKAPSSESMARAAEVCNPLYLGMSGGLHFMAVEKPLNEGNYLRWKDLPLFARVEGVCSADREGMEEKHLSQVVKEWYQEHIGHMKAAHKKAKKEKAKAEPVPYYAQIVSFRFMGIDNEQADAPRLKEGVMRGCSASVMFYHPVCDPKPAAWKERNYPVELTSVMAHKRTFGDTTVLMVPEFENIEDAPYYFDPHAQECLPVQWADCRPPDCEDAACRCIRLDRRLHNAWKDKSLISFCATDLPENPVTLKFSSLADVVNLRSPQSYHISIVPLLLKEWARRKRVDADCVAFCRAKGQMAELRRMCREHNLQIPTEAEQAAQHPQSDEQKQHGMEISQHR